MQDTRETAWNTGVPCEECEGQLGCYVAKHAKGMTIYNYVCEACDIEGPWTALAIRRVGHKSAARGKSKRRSFK